MMDKMKADTMGNIYNIITEDTHAFTKEVIFEALQYLYNDFDFISVLTRSTYVNLPQGICDFIASILDNISDIDKLISDYYQITADYAKTSYIASIESVISLWIKSGGQESPKQMAKIIYKITL